MMVQRKRSPKQFACLHWALHCGRRIFLDCARRRSFMPRVEQKSEARLFVLTCYHCGQEFRVPESDLEAGPVTYDEVNQNFRGARYV
jgi:transcription elongation factor Elf1